MKRRPVASASVATQNWVNGMGGAGARYSAGVTAAVNAGINPGALAAAAVTDYVAGVQRSSAKWATKLSALSPQQWLRMCTSLGASNLGPAAAAKQAHYQTGVGPVLADITAAKSQISSMPGNSYSARKARWNTYSDYLHNQAAQRHQSGTVPSGG